MKKQNDSHMHVLNYTNLSKCLLPTQGEGGVDS